MTDEEIQALRDELKDANDSISKLEKKNSEVIRKNKKLSTEYSEDEFNKLLDRNEVLEAEHKKLEKANGVLSKDLEKSNLLVTEKDGSLSKLLIDDGIAKSLNGLDKHKLNDGALELATMAIKSKGVELVDGVAMIGDKALNDYITTDWLEDGASKNLVTANSNTGGGAGGGTGGGSGNVDRSKMSPDQMMNAGRE